MSAAPPNAMPPAATGPTASSILRLGALCTGLAVAIGAFGAHALADQLETVDRTVTWDTAVLYHLIHGVALFALGASSLRRARLIATLWTLGILLFSGSLYALCMLDDGNGTWNWLGAITPLGGTGMIAGWLLAAVGRTQHPVASR